MAEKCMLVCNTMNQQVTLTLLETPKDISSFDFSNCLGKIFLKYLLTYSPYSLCPSYTPINLISLFINELLMK